MLNENIFYEPIYGWDFEKKSKYYDTEIKKLTLYHTKNCKEYKIIVFGLNNQNFRSSNLENLPFIPVKLFKQLELMSINKENIFKTLMSSGTSNDKPSVIYLDKFNASNQTKVLSKIVSSYLGNKRLPMLIIDSKNTLSSRKSFSARGAAILGFSLFGKDVNYALNDDLSINYEVVSNFYNKYKDQKVLIFGFTHILYNNFIKELLSQKRFLFKNDSVVIHGGGWKKMQESSITNLKFKKLIKNTLGLNKVHNYYGLVEQTGSIFFECEFNYLHCSIYSDIFVRSNILETPRSTGKGIIQLMSPLATSYPGHNILTEDIGTIIGIDNCKCGRKGKYFNIEGRLKNSELRGCSDVR